MKRIAVLVDGHLQPSDVKENVKVVFETEDGQQIHYTFNHEGWVCDEVSRGEIVRSWWCLHGEMPEGE